MRPPFVPSRRSFGRDITKRPGTGDLAKKVFVCDGCGLWHVQAKKPPQCIKCGRMDFLLFLSKDEATRWAQLLLLRQLGKITKLRRQTRFDLLAYGPEGQPVKVGTYDDDFDYERDGVLVIEDVKPHGVDRFGALKMQWMHAMGYPVTVVKVQR